MRVTNFQKMLYAGLAFVLSILFMVTTYENHLELTMLGAIIMIFAGIDLYFIAHDLVLYRDIDNQAELKAGNWPYTIHLCVRYICATAIAVAALIAIPKATGAELQPHTKLLLERIGEREIKPNCSPLIDSANKFCKVAHGSANCASIPSLLMYRAGVREPGFISARAKDFIKKESIKLPLKNPGKYDFTNYLLIFTRKGGGHLATYVSKDSTVEANTRSGLKGSQYDGDGIWKRYRPLAQVQHPTNIFRATNLTKVPYPDENKIKNSAGAAFSAGAGLVFNSETNERSLSDSNGNSGANFSKGTPGENRICSNPGLIGSGTGTRWYSSGSTRNGQSKGENQIYTSSSWKEEREIFLRCTAQTCTYTSNG